MTIIQFPHDQKSRQEIIYKASKRKRKNVVIQQQQIYTFHIPSLSGIKDNIESLNDTMKYVTDGLYAIALEIKEIKDLLKHHNDMVRRLYSFVKFIVLVLVSWWIFHKR